MRQAPALKLLGLAVLLGCLWMQQAEAQPSAGWTDAVPPAMDCRHLGSGSVYDVGPGLAYASVGAVPWPELGPGDTVRIHWRAEPYREKVLIRGQGTAEQPITVCGVAGPGGELPVLDGDGATTAPTMRYQGSGTQARGLIHLSWGQDDPWGHKPMHVVIQGLEVRNAFHEHSFLRSDGETVAYANNAAGIFIERGEHITVRGVLIRGNGNGFFVASGDEEATRSRQIVLEHSVVRGNGTVTTGFDRHHEIYTEAEGMLFQFNAIGPLRPGAGGSALKDRSAGTVIRYNRIEGGARSLDLVDAEDSWRQAVAAEAYRRTFVYGNLLLNGPGGPTHMVHYGGDSGVSERYRKGTLHFYNNTVAIVSDQEGQDGRWRVVVFDVETEEETVDARNNIVFLQPATPGARASDLAWMRSGGVLELGVNWASSGITAFRDGVEPSGAVHGMDRVLGGDDPGFLEAAASIFLLGPDGASVDRGQALHPAAVAAGHTLAFEYLHPASAQPREANGPLDLGAYEHRAGTAP